MLKALAVLLLLLLSLFSSIITIITPSAAFGQTYYQNPVDGFRVQVPAGWVIEDIDNADPTALEEERYHGVVALARLCRAEDSLPGIGGTYQCPQPLGPEDVGIYRYADLHSRLQFATLLAQNKNISSSDLVAFHIKFNYGSWRDDGIENFRLNSTEDMTVNVLSSQANQTTAIEKVPAKFVQLTYDGYSERLKMFDLLALDNNTNTGYDVHTSGWHAALKSPSPEVQQIIESFELLDKGGGE